MEKNIIIASEITYKSGKKVWKVTVQGSEAKDDTMYSKTALGAIREMYILRGKDSDNRTISDNCMTRLCKEHYKNKAQAIEDALVEYAAIG